MQIGDAVRIRADAPHRETLGPMADQIGNRQSMSSRSTASRH